MAQPTVYNFYEVLQSRLRQAKVGESEKYGEKLMWLADQLDVSTRWIEKLKDIHDVPFGKLVEISKLVEFDFVVDYYDVIGKKLPSKYILNEPDTRYVRNYAEQPITTEIKLRGDVKKISTILEAMKREAEKHGGEML